MLIMTYLAIYLNAGLDQSGAVPTHSGGPGNITGRMMMGIIEVAPGTPWWLVMTWLMNHGDIG